MPLERVIGCKHVYVHAKSDDIAETCGKPKGSPYVNNKLFMRVSLVGVTGKTCVRNVIGKPTLHASQEGNTDGRVSLCGILGGMDCRRRPGRASLR